MKPGCLPLVIVLLLAAAMPFLFIGILNTALLKLHLTPSAALLVLLAIFAGSIVNVPVKRIVRTEAVVVDHGAVFGMLGMWPRLRRVRRHTVVAVNIGGCVIPVALAVYQLSFLVDVEAPIGALVIATMANVIACYFLAQPVPGVGIVMPGLIPPFVAATAAMVLAPANATPVAFISGVLGPLIGADILHLRDLTRIATAVMSIGGAGTFDGILLSGIVAAYLA